MDGKDKMEWCNTADDAALSIETLGQEMKWPPPPIYYYEQDTQDMESNPHRKRATNDKYICKGLNCYKYINIFVHPKRARNDKYICKGLSHLALYLYSG